jgi:hypothetical protein
MNRLLPGSRLVGLVLASVFLVLVGSEPARAVPVFSRKYQTSCQTCHTIFPKLNPFGQAFRLNGYRMPGETEEMVKEAPVSLGADAQKRVFPEMVYPSTLPGNAPFALNVKMASLWTSTHDESGTQTVKNDFQFPQEANLFSAGTLGDTFGFFGELTFGETPDGGTEVEIEHARFDITSAFGPQHLFNFRIGKLAPNLYDGFQEMWIMTDHGIDPLFDYNPIGFHGGTGIGDAGLGLPARVRGVEMYGVGKHRLFYTVGMAQPMLGGGPNDSFSANGKVDVYGRLDYKFGGMGLDGDTTGVTLPPENWREKSFRVGVLGYTGNATGVTFDVADDDGNPFKMEDRRYNRLGAFGSVYYRDLNVFGVYLHGKDKLGLLDPDTGEFLSAATQSYDTWFLQADYVFKPPFQGSLRYEYLKPADQAVQSQRFLNANFSFLVRANIKAMLEYHVDLRDSKNYDFVALLRFAM